jgi:hypothetical protein
MTYIEALQDIQNQDLNYLTNKSLQFQENSFLQHPHQNPYCMRKTKLERKIKYRD